MKKGKQSRTTELGAINAHPKVTRCEEARQPDLAALDRARWEAVLQVYPQRVAELCLRPYG